MATSTFCTSALFLFWAAGVAFAQKGKHGNKVEDYLNFEEHGLLRESTARLVKLERASSKVLLEELLSQKHLSGNVTIKRDHSGLIRGGELYDLRLLKTTISDRSKLEQVGVWPLSKIRFVVHGINARVEAKFRLLITDFEVEQSGSVSASLIGPEVGGMTISVPHHGVAPGGCGFSQSLDLKIHSTDSGQPIQDMAITTALQQNTLGIRTEIVKGMEEGLCRALLEPKEASVFEGLDGSEAIAAKAAMEQEQVQKPLPLGTGLKVEVGAVVIVIVLCAAFFSGFCVRGCLAKLGFCKFPAQFEIPSYSNMSKTGEDDQRAESRTLVSDFFNERARDESRTLSVTPSEVSEASETPRGCMWSA